MPLFKTEYGIVFFVHIPKTGGSTIEHMLMHLGPRIYHGHPISFGSPILAQHMHRDLYQSLIPDEISDYSFTIIRNPFDRLLSCYYYKFQGDVNNSIGAPDFRLWLEIINSRLKHSFSIYGNHFRPQCHFISDKISTFRLEDGLGNAIPTILPHHSTVIPLVHKKKSKKWDINIDQKCIELISSMYKDDFLELGYEIGDDLLGRKEIEWCETVASRARLGSEYLFRHSGRKALSALKHRTFAR